MNYCKDCKNWKNEQRELAYHSGDGFCTNGKFEYNTVDGRLVTVFDDNNIKTDPTASQGHTIETQSNKIPYNQRKRSRYALVTAENFGCNYFEKKEKSKQ